MEGDQPRSPSCLPWARLWWQMWAVYQRAGLPAVGLLMLLVRCSGSYG